MSFEIEKLVDQRNKLASDMRSMVEVAETEERGLSAEERTTWDAMNGEYEAVDGRISVIERANAIDPSVEAAIGDPVTNDVDDAEARSLAFDALLRSNAPGVTGLSADHRDMLAVMGAEARAQGVATDAAGAYTVPEDMTNSIETAMEQFGGIANHATVISTSGGGPLSMPTCDDTSNTGALLAENTVDTEQDVAFSELVLDAYKYTSKIIRVSVELMQDSAFDLNAYIASALGERLGRATAAQYATGTGSSQPNGLMTAASAGLTAASATALTHAELVALKHSVDPAYRANAKFVFNDTTLLALKGLVDTDGRPLWQPAIADAVPATIDGDRYVIDQGVGSIATGVRSVGYGDMSKYIIRRVKGFTLVRLVERYADYHQVGFVAFMRTDADLLDAGSNPFKVITQA
ncbi:MAG: phage major capsid protein [Gammaproteobacteria bacterium]|nr:phage major capsid protein [Gammaproteobacteria bacterium]